MDAKDPIRRTCEMSDNILNAYIGDLADADLLIRPVDGMNHIAWQLGHLISSERGMIEAIKPGSCPPLPEGFDENYSRKDTMSDDPSRFLTKAEYLDLMKAQRTATKAVLDSMTDEELDAPA